MDEGPEHLVKDREGGVIERDNVHKERKRSDSLVNNQQVDGTREKNRRYTRKRKYERRYERETVCMTRGLSLSPIQRAEYLSPQ